MNSKSKILFQTLKCFNTFKFPLENIASIQKNIESSVELTFQSPTSDKCGVCGTKSICAFIGYNLCDICQKHVESCFLLFHNGSVDIDI